MTNYFSFPFLKSHSENSIKTSTISTEESFFNNSMALLYAVYCLQRLFEALANRIQTLAYKLVSASFILTIACYSFLPYLLINIILASQIGFCIFFGMSSNTISAAYSPNLKSSFSKVALNRSYDSNNIRSGSLFSLHSFK